MQCKGMPRRSLLCFEELVLADEFCVVLFLLLLAVILISAAPIQEGAVVDAAGSPPTASLSLVPEVFESPIPATATTAVAPPVWTPGPKNGYEDPQKKTDRIGKAIGVTFLMVIGIGVLGGAIMQLSRRCACGRGRRPSTGQGFSRMSSNFGDSTPVSPVTQQFSLPRNALVRN